MSDRESRDNEAIADAQRAMNTISAETHPRPSAIEVDSTPKNKGGRPRGFNGMRSKMPSAMAQRFMKAGLDWQTDFALAIKANRRDRIKLWLKLLPYLITTSSKARVKRWKGKPSKAALVALQALEDRP